jgi:hypothetical protein
MRWGVISAAALGASGLAGVLIPGEVGAALDLPPATGRGRAEVRAGLGGTYAALAGWSIARRSPDAVAAVGVTWLGAGITRVATMGVDRPRTDAVFWGSLVLELGLGTAALTEAFRSARRPRVQA